MHTTHQCTPHTNPPDLFEVFEELFSQYGRLIEFDYFEILQFLRPDYEFKIFEKFTGLSLCDCLATKYFKIRDYQYAETYCHTMFFFHHRSLILYCLYKPKFLESAYYYGRDPKLSWLPDLRQYSIINQVYLLIMKDSPRANEKLTQLSQKFMESKSLHREGKWYVCSEFKRIVLESKKPSLEDEY